MYTVLIRALQYLAVTVLAVFILLPLITILGSSVTAAEFWQFPPESLSLRWYVYVLTNVEYLHSILYTFETAALAMILGVVIAYCAALGFSRMSRSAGDRAANATFLPLLFPEIALGIATYIFLIRMKLPISLWTLAPAQLVVLLPVAIRILYGALRGIRPELELAAMDLGATPREVLLRVTLPLTRPAVIAASVLVFIRSFDDLGIALFVSGPGAITLPIKLLVAAEHERGPVIAAGSSLLLLVGVFAMALLAATVGFQRAFGLSSARGPDSR